MTTLTRRGALAAGAASLALLGPRAARAASRAPAFASDPFSLGVASGDPRPDGVVLWTRLAPDPFAPDGGVPALDVPVLWEVAHDPGFRRVVRRGEATAEADLAHSVHVEVGGLRPAREYWYRFRAGDETSPPGRTRTLPARTSAPASLAFAVASCQRFEHGHFTAYRHLADDDLDLVLHVGDYVYENPIAPDAGPRAPAVPEALRTAATDLSGYRLRHALYKTDPDLQRAHAAFPWAAVLDNHDAVWDGDGAGPRDDLARRAAAYQAWYEHMPWRPARRPRGPHMQVFRRLAFGDLAQLHLLDTRQFKDDEDVCAPEVVPPNLGAPCPPALEPGRSMLGEAQERWLAAGLARSRARWDVLAQTILFAPFDFAPGPDELAYLSGWDGYPANRARVLEQLAAPGVRNAVVLTGDWHTSWVNDVPGPTGDALATEFVTTAISSDTAFTDARSAPAVGANPVVRYYAARNGYSRCTVDRERWTTEFVDVLDADRTYSPSRVSATWVVEDGRPGAQPG